MTRFPATRETYFPGGHTASPVGETLVQSDHARTLELIARHGPDGFYRGEVADRIATEIAAHGGTIRQEDLAGVPAVHARHRAGGRLPADTECWRCPAPTAAPPSPRRSTSSITSTLPATVGDRWRPCTW